MSTTLEVGKAYIVINDLNYKALQLEEDNRVITGYMAHGDKNQQVRKWPALCWYTALILMYLVGFSRGRK